MESPPKRMTRARAAKAGEPGVKTTKIVTAAAKARTTPAPAAATASTKSTAAKRKTRADERDDDDDGDSDSEREEQATRKPARARPKKLVAQAAAAGTDDELAGPAPARATRTRAVRKPATGTAAQKDEPAAPARPRGRPRKVVEPEPEGSAAEAPKKTTRGRAGTATSKAAGTATAAKPAAKKTVKFEEPDKENMEPPAPAPRAATSSMRGRPARRGGAAAARGGRAAAAAGKASEVGPKKPLSPKKVTQMPFSRDRDSSEDELAAAEKPAKPMKKSPVRPPPGSSPAKPQEGAAADKETDSTAEVNAALNPPEFAAPALSSPARRPPPSPLKDSMKSPARKIGAVPLPGSTAKPGNHGGDTNGQTSPSKPFLQSAAKRPQSPIKGLNLGSPHKAQGPQSAMKSSMFQSPAKRALPGVKPLSESRHGKALSGSPEMKPLVAAPPTPTPGSCPRPSQKLMMEEEAAEESSDCLAEDVFTNPIENIQFPGRMSAVLPREADPAVGEGDALAHEGKDEAEEVRLVNSTYEDGGELSQAAQPVVEAAAVEEEHSVLEPAEPEAEIDDPMALDEAAAEVEDSAAEPATALENPSPAPVEQPNPMYQLRERDLDPCFDLASDSEDDASSPAKGMPPSPSPSTRTRDLGFSPSKYSRRSTLGLSALADKLDSWGASDSSKEATLEVPAHDDRAVAPAEQATSADATAADQNPPVESNFFEDEMAVRPGTKLPGALGTSEKAAEEGTDEVAFPDVMVTDEDVALAQEAKEMSLLESEQADGPANAGSFDESLSEASQEYGDENQVPIDPALSNPQQPQAPVTPVRPVQKTFNTTTKIPLKPADNSTPSPLKKRSFSASRVPPRRPGVPSRNATVISYSPSKDKRRSSGSARRDEAPSAPSTPAPATPTRDIWSTMGTPARTPRRDLKPDLLRGAVVLVDVHTTEGADASGIFVELLSQMGARCMKTWHWNPSGSQGGEASSSVSSASSASSTKVGITHVVYKDGGKRTMEKVREANGVVQCVGVSWVLDCERENEWLDEAPYYIDTSMVPRGGARRRKSMEPKALANLNGTLVSSPGKGPEGRTSPTTPLNRRQSTVWMHTPSDQGDEEEEAGEQGQDDIEWSKFILTPVPKTPAPEAVARYAADVPETPCGGDGDGDEEPGSSPDKALLMQTCPPKRSSVHGDMGAGVLGRDRDERVLLRLMAARRKSLQFAPKVGSPLARAWQ